MIITVDHLTKRFGRFAAVDDLSFEVAPGQSVAMWGPNGAGKTTAIRCLLGLYRFRGRIAISGHDIRRRGRAARAAAGYVPQELCFYDDFRVMEALHFFSRLKDAPRHRAGDVLAEVGLSPHARKRVRELSGGMKQRLALALALLADPPLLLLDELTSNLDAGAQEAFVALLGAQKKAGKTILFTSHRAEEVSSLADRVLLLESGRLVSDLSAAAFAEQVRRRTVLKVVVADEAIAGAVEVLRRGGFTVSANGAGVSVEVRPDAKAEPIRALTQAEITVRDFEMVEPGGPADAGATDHV